jgi:hypothetical protein
MLTKGRAMIAKGNKPNKKKKSKLTTVSKAEKKSASKSLRAKETLTTTAQRRAKGKSAQATKKLRKRSAWKISPVKHGTSDLWVFKKDGVTIGLSQTYRFSFIIVARKPKLTNYDPNNGINIDKFNYSHYEPGDDSFGPNWMFPNNFPLEEQERIKSLWDEEHDNGMFAESWTSDVHCHFYGLLSVEKVESEYPYHPV